MPFPSFDPDPSGEVNRDPGSMTFGAGSGAAGPAGPTGPAGPAGPAGDLAGQTIYNFLGVLKLEVGTTYQTINGDTGKILSFNNGSAIAVTLHKAAPIGTNIVASQYGLGQVTFGPEAGGAILINRSSHTKIAGRYGVVSLYVRSNSGGSAAEWVLSGDTSA